MPIIKANIKDIKPDETPVTKIIKLSKLDFSNNLSVTKNIENIPIKKSTKPGIYFTNFNSLAIKFAIKVNITPKIIVPIVSAK